MLANIMQFFKLKAFFKPVFSPEVKKHQRLEESNTTWIVERITVRTEQCHGIQRIHIVIALR